MRELLFGSWGPQIAAFTRQNPLQVISLAMLAVTVAITLAFGVRGFGGDGGSSFADSDGDGGGCGGD
jgi:hypothetical protein